MLGETEFANANMLTMIVSMWVSTSYRPGIINSTININHCGAKQYVGMRVNQLPLATRVKHVSIFLCQITCRRKIPINMEY